MKGQVAQEKKDNKNCQGSAQHHSLQASSCIKVLYLVPLFKDICPFIHVKTFCFYFERRMFNFLPPEYQPFAQLQGKFTQSVKILCFSLDLRLRI